MPSRARPSRRSSKPNKKGPSKGARKAPRRSTKSAKRPAAKRTKSVKTAKRSTRKATKASKKGTAASRRMTRKTSGHGKKAARPARSSRPAHSTNSPVIEFSEVPHAARPLRIALFGASGDLGSRIAQEAVQRGHQVTGIVRHPEEVKGGHPNLTVERGDVTDLDFVAEVARQHDVVASAISPAPTNMGVLSEAAKSLLHASRASGKRVVAVGGAGSLLVAPGQQLLDTPQFPASWRPTAVAHRDALQVFKAEGGEGWTVVSPAAMMEPGKRTGRFRWGTDHLVADKKGNSRISMEDYAIAFVDEVESGRNLGRRITVGY